MGFTMGFRVSRWSSPFHCSPRQPSVSQPFRFSWSTSSRYLGESSAVWWDSNTSHGYFWLGFRILYDWGGNHSDAKKKAIGESPSHHPHFSIFMAGNHQFTCLAHCCYIPKDGLWQLWEGHGWHTFPKPRVQLKDDSTNPESRARRTPAPCPKKQIFHKISWSIMNFPLRLLLCFLVGGDGGQKIFPSLETLEIQNMSMSFPISSENDLIISIIDQWSYILIPIMIDQK